MKANPITPSVAVAIVRTLEAAAKVGPGRFQSVAADWALSLAVTVKVITDIYAKSNGNTCKTKYPGYDECSDFPYSGKPQALCAFKKNSPKAQTYRKRAATGCGAGGGTHWNVKDRPGRGWQFIGTILCCVCCEDRPDGNGGARGYLNTGCSAQ